MKQKLETIRSIEDVKIIEMEFDYKVNYKPEIDEEVKFNGEVYLLISHKVDSKTKLLFAKKDEWLEAHRLIMK